MHSTATSADSQVYEAVPSRGTHLSDRHLAELLASGITDETIEAAGIYTANGDEVRRIVGWNAKDWNWSDGMVFPYAGCNGYARVKPDYPRENRDGKPVKYESPAKSQNRAYFPATFDASTKTIVIVEGEKKCLAVSQLGISCIGISGVWAWQVKRLRDDFGKAFGPRRLIPDLGGLNWEGCDVVVCFDSDAVENYMVQLAEHCLCQELQKCGASVRVARIPKDGDAKVGADDFIVNHGADAFRALLELAEPPAPLEKLSPMDWARRFIGEHFDGPGGLELRWWRDEYFRFNGRCYVKLSESELRAVVHDWLDRCGAKPTARQAVEVVRACDALCRIPFSTDWPIYLSEKPPNVDTWLSMENGIVDIEKVISAGKDNVRPHTPLFFSPFTLPYSFDSNAECPTWFTTLHDILNDDEQLVDLLGEWFGYCLTSDTAHQAIMLLEGPPRSGKGTVMRALRHVVGAANCHSPRLHTLGETFGLWGLVGKRVAMVSDAMLGHGDKAIAILETLKLISGEDSVEVHRKNLPPIDTRLRVRFTLAVNELPKFGDHANALAARLLIIPFRKSFVGQEDRKLEGRIEAEAPGIFRWAIEGLARLRRAGRFTDPDVSKSIREDFARLTSPTRAFIEDECVIDPTATVSREDLWAAWRDWCDRNGNLAGSKDRLGTQLRSVVPEIRDTRPRVDGRRERSYAGIGLSGPGGPGESI